MRKKGVEAILESIEERVDIRMTMNSEKLCFLFQKIGVYSTVFLAVFLIALISASTFMPADQTNAEDVNVAVDNTGYYVDIASNSSVDLNVAAVVSGQVVVGADQITTRSNCTSGFRVYMSVDSDTYDGLYLNGNTAETTNKFNASSGTPTQPIKLATNTWGFAIPKTDGSSYGFNTEYVDSNGVSSTGATGQSIMNIDEQLFAGVPKIGNEVLVQSYDTAATSGVTQKIYYGVNATTALVSGNYTGKVVYTAVADVGSGETTDRIGISPAEGSPDGGEVVVISTNIYSTMSDTQLLEDFSVKIGGEDCALTGITRTVNGALNFQCTTPAGTLDDIVDVVLTSIVFDRSWTLEDGFTYAIPKITIAEANTLQEVNSCPDTLEIGRVYSVIDSRDNQSYHVARLADGRCWFLDNLALDLTNTTVLSGMNSSNTNASNIALDYLRNGGGSTSDQYAIAAVSTLEDQINYSAPLVNMTKKDDVPDGAPDDGAGNNKAGGYYNFCAASAGSYCYGDGSSEGTSSGNATEDICPFNWRMPTGAAGASISVIPIGEYFALYDAYNSNDMNFKNALSTPFSGYFFRGSAQKWGSAGYFWSSTRVSDEYSNMLIVNVSGAGYNGDVSPGNGILYRRVGASIRCVLK